METITDNSLVDWLYNRFVEAVRKNDYSKSFIYEDVLNKTIHLLPAGRKYSALKRRAKALTKEILKASKSSSPKELHYTGAEFVADFKRAIAEYEQELRDLDIDEETIKEMVIEKKMNYGYD
jgi:hypothetical protein